MLRYDPCGSCPGSIIDELFGRWRKWVIALSVAQVRFNYMSHDDDWLEMRACIRLTREIFAQEALVPYRGRELAP